MLPTKKTDSLFKVFQSVEMTVKLDAGHFGDFVRRDDDGAAAGELQPDWIN